jgi:hypothetical protein
LSAFYELWLTTDSGVRLAALDNFVSLSCGRLVNGVGKFSLQMPASFDDTLLTAPDRMLQVWRQPTGGRLGLWRTYFIRRWRFEMRGSDEIVTVGGPDANDLLRRRIVAAYAGSAQASKTDLADDMMKEVVTQAIANGVAPTPTAGTRVWSNLSIAADLGDGPSITQSFPFHYLLTGSNQGVLAILAKAAREAGDEVFFDIVPNVVSSNSITFQFQTFTGQPGQDVTSRVSFDQASGNMQNPSLEYDYEEEENYIYAAGQGEEADRNIQQVYDSVRYGASIWNRCEGFADARNQSTDNGVRESGRAKLEDGRPRIRFTAQPMDTAGTRFGIDWNFGDKAIARYRNREFDCIIRAVVISKDGGDAGKEDISARLDYEAVIG